MRAQKRWTEAAKEIDSQSWPSSLARELKRVLRQFEEIYLPKLEKFEVERRRFPRMIKLGRKLVREINECSIAQGRDLDVDALKNFVKTVESLSEKYSPRKWRDSDRFSELATYIGRVLVNQGINLTTYPEGPFVRALRVAFTAHGKTIADEGLRRYARRIRKIFKEPDEKQTTPQRLAVYGEYFFDCAGIKKDRELTNRVRQAWEANRQPVRKRIIRKAAI